jgi:membrane protein YqaA with SNARE-associated domain
VLFDAAFLAATILPFSPGLILFAPLREGRDPGTLLAVATIANTLGSVVDWYPGRYLLRFRDRPWFYFSRDQIERARAWCQRYGFWSRLLAWLPIGGDAPALIAGIMKLRLSPLPLLIATGKGLRYLSAMYLPTWSGR